MNRATPALPCLRLTDPEGVSDMKTRLISAALILALAACAPTTQMAAPDGTDASLPPDQASKLDIGILIAGGALAGLAVLAVASGAVGK
jgi:hypothetical protein